MFRMIEYGDRSILGGGLQRFTLGVALEPTLKMKRDKVSRVVEDR
jgi:hypothetical protein